MSNIEEKFFETFEIEPKYKFKGCENGITFYTYGCDIPSCKGCPKEIKEKNYPQITDSILLELVCVAMEYRDYPTTVNIRNIKERTLRLLIGTKKYLKDTFSSKSYHNRLVRKVQSIFKK